MTSNISSNHLNTVDVVTWIPTQLDLEGPRVNINIYYYAITSAWLSIKKFISSIWVEKDIC